MSIYKEATYNTIEKAVKESLLALDSINYSSLSVEDKKLLAQTLGRLEFIDNNLKELKNGV